MSKKQYLQALNKEIQKLNDVIDLRILNDMDYRHEARRHKKLITEARRRELNRSVYVLGRILLPSWLRG